MSSFITDNQREALRRGRQGEKGFQVNPPSKREIETEKLLKLKKLLSPAEWQRLMKKRKAEQKRVKAAVEKAEAKKRRDKKAAEQKLHSKKPRIAKKKAHSGR